MDFETAAAQLRPCPFCDQQPEIGPWGPMGKVMVACIGDTGEAERECQVAPQLFATSAEQAINIWNWSASPADAIRAKALEDAAAAADSFDTFDHDTVISANRAAVAIGIAEAIRALAVEPVV